MAHPVSTNVPHRVYGSRASGNCHKVLMTMEALGLPYRWHETDIMKGQTRTREFLAMNPNGKVPLLQVDDHTFLPESNAIVCYLADGTRLWPGDRLARAQVLAWMFFEQYSHEPYVAVARFVRLFLEKDDDPRLPMLLERGNAALGVMERHLKQQAFFAANGFSIADIALFAYTHRAVDGSFDLSKYPAVQAWLDRCRQQPGVSEMPAP